MLRYFLGWIPAPVRSAIREFSDLPPKARAHWLRAFVRRRFGQDLTTLPGGLVPLPRVLFVCYGNLYRSSAAASVFSDDVARSGFPISSIRSAGLRASANRPAPDDALVAASSLGIKLEGHQTTPLSPQILAESDLIVIMDRRNEALLAALDPACLSRTVLLGAFAPADDGDAVIPDPYGNGVAAVTQCYTRVRQATAGLLEALRKTSTVHEPRGLAAWGGRQVRRVLTSPLLIRLSSFDRRSAASVLMLHRFANPDLGVSGHDPEQLRENLAFLRRNDFHICALDELVAMLAAGMAPLPNTVVFTVDDGYADFAEIGAPIFAEFDVPATTFLITSFVGSERWVWYDVIRYCANQHLTGRFTLDFDGQQTVLAWRNATERRAEIRKLIAYLHSCPTESTERVVAEFPRLLGVSLPDRPTQRFSALTWEDVRRWEERGMKFGPHTHTHPILARSSSERVREELMQSMSLLREHVRSPSGTLCFPSGTPRDYSPRDQEIASSLGLAAAVTAHGGRAGRPRTPSELFAIPRLAYEPTAIGFRWLVGGVSLSDRGARA